MRRSSVLAALGVVLIAMALCPAASGQTWGIEAGISESNPSGVWTYGYQNPLGGILVPFTTRITSSGLYTWCINNDPNTAGCTNHNTTALPVDLSGMYWYTGGTTLHPGPNDEKATLRWTAPYAATVNVNVTFFGANYGAGATTDVHVLKNGVALYDNLINGYGGGEHATFGTSPSQAYNGTVTVAQGDRIDFAVGYGGNGYGSDMTGISGWIAETSPGQPIVNEIQSANSATIADEDGSHPDWIEIFNAGGEPVNLLDYGLSDDAAMPFKWTFPSVTLQPGAFMIVFASDKDRKTGPCLHTNYAIKSGGEPISLTAPSGTLVSQIPATSIPEDMSYGRKPDAQSDMYLFADPTPGSPNTTAGYIGTLAAPLFSRARGFYSSAFNLTLTTSVPGAVIHYTTDGSEPTEASPTYTAPMAIPSASSGQAPRVTIVRARALKTDYAPSPVVTNSYFVGPNSSTRYNLPVVSLVTTRANFFDPEIGIYVYGNHGNYNLDGDAWERPIHVEFFEPGGACGFHCDAGVRIHGGGSVMYAQKSLRLYADHQGGPGSFDYQIFPESTVTDYKRIILRNGGQDTPLDPTYGARYTLIHDGFAQSLVNQMDVDAQYYRPGLVFFNGEYWGIFGIMEREDKYWIANRHPEIDPDNLDLIQQHPSYYAEVLEVAEGDLTALNAMRDYFQSNDLIVPANYEYVKTKMDLASLLIHHIANIYFGNTDWPGNNIRYWRPRTEDGKWRWAICDCDITFSFWNPANQNTLADATQRGSAWPNDDAVCVTLASLLRNREARDEFINRTADMLNTVLAPSVVVEKLDSLQALLSPNMAEHFTRWGAGNVSTWNNNIQIMRDFANQRPGYLRSHYVEFFRLGGTANITLNAPSPSMGTITINTISIPNASLPWQGTYFQDVPITLTAVPAAGYRFVRWNGGGLGTQNPATVKLTGDAVVTALFEVNP